MNTRYRKKTGVGYAFLFILICLISLGYAILSSNLVIDGTAKISKATWDVHYENINVTAGSVSAALPEILDDTTVKYTVNLSKPGDFYEFTVDVVNKGTIDAIIDKVIQSELTDKEKKYLSYSLTYDDGSKISQGDELPNKQTKTLKVRLEFMLDVNASDLPTEGDTINMKLETEYIQAGITNALSDWNNDGILKVLTIGNSYTQDAMGYAYQVGKALGIENMELAYLYIGGCSLATHLTNATNDSTSYTYYTNNNGTWHSTSNYKISDAVASANWDYIVFQQYSGASGKEDSYDSLVPLMEKVKESINEDATPKFVWHMTWAYAEGYSGLSNYDNSQMTMYNGIVNAVKTKVVPNSEISIIIPSGTAIQNARTSLGDTLNRDGTHLSVDGKYIAGLMYIKSLTGANLDNISYVPTGGSNNLMEIAIKSVNEAYKNPFNVTTIESESDTPSEPETPNLPEIPEIEGCDATEGYQCLEINFTEGFRNSQTAWDALDSHSLLGQYWTTQMFTKSDIPNGSIIKIADGWQYRPEGWSEEGKKNSLARPGQTHESTVVVDDTWWSYYNYRCFNINLYPSNPNINTWELYTADDYKNILQIYIPISDGN